MSDNRSAFISLIETSISTDPYEFNGSLWCRLSHTARAQAVGCDEKTIERLIRKPPFVWDRIRLDKQQVCLVRVGEKTPADLLRVQAKTLAKLFNGWLKKHTPKDRDRLMKERAKLVTATPGASGQELNDIKDRLKRVNHTLRTLRPRLPDKDFGLFVELARRWPEGLHGPLMDMVLSRWSEFMGRVKVDQATQLALGAPIEPRYYAFPFLIAILNYAQVAVDMMEEDYMTAGKTPPASLQVVHPHLWHHLKAPNAKKKLHVPF